MDLKELQELSVVQTKAGPKNVKQYLDRIRKNLMTLMCQSDVIELTGDLNAFGGDKDVSVNISKAVFSLFCVGSVLGVDVTLGLEKVASDARTRLIPPSSSAIDTVGREVGSQADLWTTEKKAGIEADSSAAQSKNGGVAGKEKKIENYRDVLRSSRDRASIEAVWKSISEDKELNGQNKYQLQDDKKEALKRVAAKTV